jgi:hypothetical protein
MHDLVLAAGRDLVGRRRLWAFLEAMSSLRIWSIAFMT